jgi:PIN domain nuclease of toxin-antitoxin system
MNLLLDTHALLWFLGGDKQLSKKAKAAIEDSNNTCYISIASCWEITIKYSLGKLQLEASLEELFDEIEKEKFIVLPISPEHLKTLSTLKFHHKDPFDRLIIAQAKKEKCVLVSADEYFVKYPINIVW